MLDLEGAGRPVLSQGESPEADFDVPREMFPLDRKEEKAFPIERALLFSLAIHVLILVLFLSAPAWSPPDPHKSAVAAFAPAQMSAEEKIPVIFREAPGPARENPKKSSLSDQTRRAGGGDPSRPRSESPFAALRPGKEGLKPGGRTASAPARPASNEPAETAGAFAGQKESGGIEPFRIAPPGPGSPGRAGAKLPGLDRAIAEAAKGIGRDGEEGAGTPNPEGGFVDSGPLSFDTTWYDWGPYAEEMVRRIKLHWDIPELARLGWKGKLTIRFFILADGRVEGATILSRSGVPPFDFAALQAILKSSPFRPLPEDLGSHREGVTVTFFYNIRPSEKSP